MNEILIQRHTTINETFIHEGETFIFSYSNFFSKFFYYSCKPNQLVTNVFYISSCWMFTFFGCLHLLTWIYKSIRYNDIYSKIHEIRETFSYKPIKKYRLHVSQK